MPLFLLSVALLLALQHTRPVGKATVQCSMCTVAHSLIPSPRTIVCLNKMAYWMLTWGRMAILTLRSLLIYCICTSGKMSIAPILCYTSTDIKLLRTSVILKTSCLQWIGWAQSSASERLLDIEGSVSTRTFCYSLCRPIVNPDLIETCLEWHESFNF